jgi:hypothetical protein
LFEFIYYQLLFDGKVIASGDYFGLSDTKEFYLPGPSSGQEENI